MRRQTSIKQSLSTLPVLLVLRVAVAALDLLPVYQLDRRRNHALEPPALDRFPALAAARRRFVCPAMELAEAPARRFDLQRVEAAPNDRPAEAHVVLVELDPHH